MEIGIHIHGMGDEDLLARRIVADASQSDHIGHAGLARREASGGERGIIEEIGAVALTLLNAGGAEFVFDLLRQCLSVGQPQAGNQREIIVDLGGGRRLELRGGMSDEDFRGARDRVIALVEAGGSDATA